MAREKSDGRLTLTGLGTIVIAVLCGVLLGLGLTIRSLDLDARGVTAGAWRSTPREGSGDVDPYALAANARAGLLPLGAAEGLTFIASADDAGATLDKRCDYVVRGPMPPARDWTLSLLDASGFPVANPSDRYGFTSSEVLRLTGEPVTIVVSPQAQSGNWLPTGPSSPFKLMLRLYDTSLSTGGTAIAQIKMPAIVRSRCQ